MTQLTPEQEALIPVIRDKWINFALYSGSDINMRKAAYHIRKIYELSGLSKPKKIVKALSPLEAQLIANKYMKTPEMTFFPFLAYCGLGFDTDYLAWVDFWEQQGEKINVPELKHIKGIALAGVWDSIVLDEVAIVVARPSKVVLDSEQRLHNRTGPAVEWANGDKNYFLCGMDAESWWCEEPEKLTVQYVLNHENVEIRRELIAQMGERFLAEANPVILDEDVDASGMPRQLLRIDLQEDEPYVAVRVQCPSTGKIAHLRVPPSTTRCSEAVAWTFGFTAPDSYQPRIEA